MPPGASYQPAASGSITLDVANAAAITSAQREAIRTGLVASLSNCIGVSITGIATGSAIVSYQAYFSTDAQADAAISTITSASVSTVKGWINGASSGNAGLFNGISLVAKSTPEKGTRHAGSIAAASLAATFAASTVAASPSTTIASATIATTIASAIAASAIPTTIATAAFAAAAFAAAAFAAAAFAAADRHLLAPHLHL